MSQKRLEQKPSKECLPFFSAYKQQSIELLLKEGQREGQTDSR